MKSFWEKLISEKVSEEHRKNVLQAARGELAKNFSPPFTFKLAFSLGVSIVAAAGIWYFQQQIETEHREQSEEITAFEIDADEVDDLEMVSELDFLEDMEVIEQWSAI